MSSVAARLLLAIALILQAFSFDRVGSPDSAPEKFPTDNSLVASETDAEEKFERSQQELLFHGLGVWRSGGELVAELSPPSRTDVGDCEFYWGQSRAPPSCLI